MISHQAHVDVVLLAVTRCEKWRHQWRLLLRSHYFLCDVSVGFLILPSFCWMLPRGFIERSFLLLLSLLLFSYCKGVATSPVLTWECPASQKGSHDSERANVTFESGPFPDEPAVYWDPRTIKLSLSKKKNCFSAVHKANSYESVCHGGHFLCATQMAPSLCTDPLNFVPSDPLVTLYISWTCTLWESQRQTGRKCLQ